ncbi:NAD(P)H-dependent oxidoreductase [Pseudomonas donghuensis]|uniref:NAD(P)H-dependent oxidoreductase n=1 Tax=Pseudomonas donghuensis TaxID=1163398 RepID=UPI0021602AB0|nr:NAD(P)H-dependent oxidoreductase [Pseudomonas donghuensis]UVL31454.1 NAD(P)H-dependent oxidoreductase [Pseudomonas donghuensis]
MHALVVVAHHDPRSLTHSLAATFAEGLAHNGDRAEVVDLYGEGFNPLFGPADHAVHHRATAPADVLAEQARIDRSDALVLIYPVYWWSMPALLKGWIDRVFVNGWAFDFSPQAPLAKRLRHLNVHLVGVGGADAATYARHGYEQAMKTQIDHGIFDYCGARVLSSTLLLDSESADPGAHLQSMFERGRTLFAEVPEPPEAAACSRPSDPLMPLVS